jgi:hypothetical protein
MSIVFPVVCILISLAVRIASVCPWASCAIRTAGSEINHAFLNTPTATYIYTHSSPPSRYLTLSLPLPPPTVAGADGMLDAFAPSATLTVSFEVRRAFFFAAGAGVGTERWVDGLDLRIGYKSILNIYTHLFIYRV